MATDLVALIRYILLRHYRLSSPVVERRELFFEASKPLVEAEAKYSSAGAQFSLLNVVSFDDHTFV